MNVTGRFVLAYFVVFMVWFAGLCVVANVMTP
jgi:hypothetical protein